VIKFTPSNVKLILMFKMHLLVIDQANQNARTIVNMSVVSDFLSRCLPRHDG